MAAGVHVGLSAYRATCAGTRMAADGYHFAVLMHPHGRFFSKEESPATCLEEFFVWPITRFETPAGSKVAVFSPSAFMTKSLTARIAGLLLGVKGDTSCRLSVEGGRMSLLDEKMLWLATGPAAEKTEGFLAARSWVVLIPEQKVFPCEVFPDKTLVRRTLGADFLNTIERTATLAASCGVTMLPGDIAKAIIRMEAHLPEAQLALEAGEGYYVRDYKGSDPYLPSTLLAPSGLYVIASHHKRLSDPWLLQSKQVCSSYAFKVAAEPVALVAHAVSGDPSSIKRGLRLQGKVANTPLVVGVAEAYRKGAGSVTRYVEERPFSTLAMTEKELASVGAYLMPEEVLQIASALLISLVDLHAWGFAHRGLSPDSIRLHKVAEGYLARVGFFQRACRIDDRVALSDPGPASFMTDPLLCQLFIEKGCATSEAFAKLDPRAGDIWALGALLFLLIVQESLVGSEEGGGGAAAGGAGSDTPAAAEDALVFDIRSFAAQCSRSGWVTTRLTQLGKIDKIDSRLLKLLQSLLEPKHEKRVTALKAKGLVEILMTPGYESVLTARRPSLAGKGAS